MGRCAGTGSRPAGRTGSNPVCLAEVTEEKYIYIISIFYGLIRYPVKGGNEGEAANYEESAAL